MNKVPVNRLLYILIIIIMIVIVYITYMIGFHHNPPIIFNNLPFPVDREIYHAGDVVVATLDYCRYTSAPFRVDMSFSNDLLFSVPGITREGAPVGCAVISTNVLTIPDSIPPGHYILTGKSVYKVNFMTSRQVDWSTVEFEVVP